MTPEERKFRAADAKSLLGNKLYKEAFSAMAHYLETQAMSCDPDNKEKAARIIISKQLLAGLRREIERVVEDGVVAEVQLAELKRQGVLKRFIR
jgi:hypothetical protein